MPTIPDTWRRLPQAPSAQKISDPHLRQMLSSMETRLEALLGRLPNGSNQRAVSVIELDAAAFKNKPKGLQGQLPTLSRITAKSAAGNTVTPAEYNKLRTDVQALHEALTTLVSTLR